MSATSTDPRRFGVGAAALCGVYAVDLFLPGTVLKLVAGLKGPMAAVALAVWAPLPRWKEADRRKIVAAWAMAGEAIVIAALVTAVRVFVG